MKHTSFWTATALITACLFAGMIIPAAGVEKIKVMLPGPSTAFAPLYHAQSAGYFATEGLDVEILMASGAAGIQALLARDAQFALTPGTFQIQAYERGQRLIAVMSILTHTHINVVMHQDVARAKGITEKSPLVEKMRALKGLTVPVSPRAASRTRCSSIAC